MKKNLLLLFFLCNIFFANAQLSGYYKQGFEDTIFPPQGWDTINNDNQNENSSEWLQAYYPHVHEGSKSAYSENARNEFTLKEMSII